MQAVPKVLAKTTVMSVSGISKSFAGVHALTDVSFEIRPSEVHALVGENGAGKSTLMAIASGALAPDSGTIFVGDQEYAELTPALAKELGIAIVHQHPALLPDLTVSENIRLAVPLGYFDLHDSDLTRMQEMLDEVGLEVHLNERVKNLTIAQKHLLEVAKALAVDPKVLILDEPTAPLGKESVDLLFDHVRSITGRGTAVVYITHRLEEVNLLADRVTVLRDGFVTGTGDVETVTDDQLLHWIVGRHLDRTFPAKRSPDKSDDFYLRVNGLTGDYVSDVSFTARIGEIVGIAGIAGNGQSELLATLAGLAPFEGTIEINGAVQTTSQLRMGSAYMPADRHEEGLMMSLSVRENVALSALDQFKQRFLVSRGPERQGVQNELDGLAVKTPSIDANIASLSGGNQQKVVMARALLSSPKMVVADEPTQGVDVGARAEIYHILREIANAGIPVVVSSSDAQELEGLCDRVIVLSRGHAVANLAGDEVEKQAIIRSAVSATAHKRETDTANGAAGSTTWRRFLQGDYAPVVTLALVIIALGIFIYSGNPRYISAFNITSVLMLVSALGFIANGQTVVLMIGGIDLSVGPLAGFAVVVGSFFINNDKTIGTILIGFLLMLLAALAFGLLNGVLVRYVKFTAVAATLTTYIAVSGLSFVFRKVPGGLMNSQVTKLIQTKLGPVPVIFLLLIVITLGMEWILRKSRWGNQLRALGSDEESARTLGVRTDRMAITAFVVSSLFVFFGAIVLIAQLGIGDPAQGIGYTLSSVTAVVLGGTSLLGGRGTFVGTLFGSILMIQVLNATVFLGLSQTWQYFFQGALILVAAVIYSQARGATFGLRPTTGM